MRPWKLLTVLVFCIVIRGGLNVVLGSRMDPYYADLLAQIVMFLALLGICVKEFKIDSRKRREILGSFRVGSLATGIGLASVLLLFTFGESALVTWAISQNDPALAYELGKFHERTYPSHAFFSVHILSFIVASVLIPAIAEEIFFRGLLFPALADKRSYFSAALICSLIFTILHFSKTIYLHTFIFAFSLCYLYLKQKSIYTCIVTHAVFNLFAFLQQHYFDFHRTRSIDQISSLFDWIPQLGMLMGSTIIILAIIYRQRKAFRQLDFFTAPDQRGSWLERDCSN